jgi:hypothetical protein
VLDFEAPLLSLYTLTAVVADSIAPSAAAFASLSASQLVALYVTDVNEAPLISAQACKVQEQTIFNNSPQGTVVSCNGAAGGMLFASDPDTPLLQVGQPRPTPSSAATARASSPSRRSAAPRA